MFNCPGLTNTLSTTCPSEHVFPVFQMMVTLLRLESSFCRILNAFRVKSPLFCQAFLSNGIQIIRFCNLKNRLPDNGAGIFSIVDKMDRTAPHLATISKGITISIHTRKSRQQGRMNIHDPLGPWRVIDPVNEIGRQCPHKTRQHQQIKGVRGQMIEKQGLRMYSGS